MGARFFAARTDLSRGRILSERALARRPRAFSPSPGALLARSRIGLGIVLLVRPNLGALSLAEVLGLFALAYGVKSLVLANRTDDTNNTLSQILG